MPPHKGSVARPTDYIYDPLFIVSGPKDHMKAALIAKMSMAKFQICPIFPSMFSDLPQCPRQQIVMRKTHEPLPPYVTKTALNANGNADIPPSSKPVDISGTDRHRYFYSAPKNLTQEIVPMLPLLQTPRKIVKPLSSENLAKVKNAKIQTQYRDSSAQTSPWQPDYKVMDRGDPEILKLDFLRWGSGLPVGMHELRLIERARMKRKWEQALPPITGHDSLNKRKMIVEAIERDEWAFREQEIQDIHNLRMELLERMLEELHAKTKTRADIKIKMFCEKKQREKEEKVSKLKRNHERELRKLKLSYKGLTMKYKKWDIINEFADPTSELYAPLMRHGEHPKRGHQVIDEHLKKYKSQFEGVEHLTLLPKWLDRATKANPFKSTKLPGTRLCVRETKWTTPVLKQLHQDLTSLRRSNKHKCFLRVRIEKEEDAVETPEAEGIDESDEEIYQAALLIGSVVRGRGTQVMIHEGRDRCKELIQELRSTHAVLEDEKLVRHAERVEVKMQQRDELIADANFQNLHEGLNKLQGVVVGSLLDFLNKELRRLLDERRAHAICLLAERERHHREAAEAGRRQAELQRRKEHDEMFKQVVKIRQDTVDLYLQDIITEGMEFTNEAEAKNFAHNLADKIDKETEQSMKLLHNATEQEEMVADLVHNFLLPEIEKHEARRRLQLRQKKYIKAAYEVIYNEVEELPKPPPQPSRDELHFLKKSMAPSSLLPPILRTQVAAKTESEVASRSEENEAAGTIYNAETEQHTIINGKSENLVVLPFTSESFSQQEQEENFAKTSSKDLEEMVLHEASPNIQDSYSKGLEDVELFQADVIKENDSESV